MKRTMPSTMPTGMTQRPPTKSPPRLIIALVLLAAAAHVAHGSQASIRLTNNEYSGLVIGFSDDIPGDSRLRETLVRELQVSSVYSVCATLLPVVLCFLLSLLRPLFLRARISFPRRARTRDRLAAASHK